MFLENTGSALICSVSLMGSKIRNEDGKIPGGFYIRNDCYFFSLGLIEKIRYERYFHKNVKDILRAGL